MTAFLHWLMNAHAFMSHGHCYLWNRSLVALHVSSDLLIGIAYVAISITLLDLIRRARKDMPFHWVFIAFGAFILACAATHLMEVWTIWTPVYWLSGGIKALTAAASIVTAIVLPPIVPKSLLMMSEAHSAEARRQDLEAANAALRTEIEERTKAELEIRNLNRALELLVKNRTSELGKADATLSNTLRELERNQARFENVGEDSFYLIANALPQLAWIADQDGWIYWYNQRWYDYTGTTAEDMKGWGWQSVHDPTCLPKVLEHWKKSIATGQPFDMEFPLRGADGQYRMFMTRGLPVKDRDGRTVRWVGTNTDVEERRRTEERLRHLYASGIMGVFSWTGDGCINDANDKFLDIAGYTRDDLRAGELRWSSISPADYRVPGQGEPVELREWGVIEPVEKEIIRKDGGKVAIELGSAISTGDSLGGVAFVLDITRRKQIEARLVTLNQNLAESQASLQAVLNGATGVAIIAYDRAGLIKVFNTGAERMLQYRADEVIGMETPALFLSETEYAEVAAILTQEPKQPARGVEVFSESLRRGRYVERDCTFLRKDGSTLHVSLSTTAIRNASDEVTGFVGIARDITARRALERELRGDNLLLERRVQERTHKLQSALAEKTVLLQEVHHRVKNSLAVVASLLSMQADALNDEEAKRPLFESQRRVHSMALIHEHLYGTDNLSRIRFDQYAEKLAGELYAAFSSPSRMSVNVQAEPIQLPIDKAIPCGLIVNELLSNSFKYAFPNGCTGQIDVSFAETVPGRLTLAVSDNGVGLPGELDLSAAKSLGLKIVQILADQLNGELKLHRNPGTRFELTFPIADGIIRSRDEIGEPDPDLLAIDAG